MSFSVFGIPIGKDKKREVLSGWKITTRLPTCWSGPGCILSARRSWKSCNPGIGPIVENAITI